MDQPIVVIRHHHKDETNKTVPPRRFIRPSYIARLLALLCIFILVVALFFIVDAWQFTIANAATPEDVWVSTDDTIAEYTQSGVLVTSAIPIPYGGGSRPVTESARDLIVGTNGIIQIYDGTFDPFLNSYYPITDTWTHQPHTGWSTVNNGSYGGIAQYQNYVFVTDMNTFGDGGADAAMGIVRFDTTGGPTVRFANTQEFIDLTIGLDDLLYALRGNESAVDVYMPSTNTFVRTINLASDVRGIAVNEEGQIFAASWDDNIYHFDANGAQLNFKASGTFDLHDIDITCDGQIAVGSRFGLVTLTNESLANVTSFSVGTENTFVAFSNPRTSCVYIPVILP